MTTKILRSVHAIEGADMPVRRAFAAHGGVSLDPFLMLDHFGPARLTPASQGFPAHPHKGFETVTYMFSGGIEHNDSFGGHAVIGPGDVQWMTAGSGIVHSETPPDDMRHGDVTVEGLQVWVNLPKAKKLHAPGYVVLKGDELPRYRSADGQVEGLVIAGTLPDVVGAVEPKSPLTLALIRIKAGGHFSLPLPDDWHAGVYVAKGALETVTDGHTVIYPTGSTVDITAKQDSTVLLMAGKPIGEPVVAYGPFVMSSEGEIRQAMLEYQSGKFGKVA
jgi:redox-sensitive bicupin YhaK (pirin superfamily)